MTPPALPRVLVVTSSAFNHITGGGITFSALFRGWPADRLATVHNDIVPTAADICRLYYRLGQAEIGRWPHIAGARPLSRAAVPARAARAAGAGFTGTLKKAIIGNAWPDSGRLTPPLERWIADFRPDVLYTILGTIGMMGLVDDIRRRFMLPLVVHFMDDWPSHLYRGGLLSMASNLQMRRLLHRLIGVASDRLAIGDAMADAYRRRYGQPFAVFQNAVDIGALDGHLCGRSGSRTRGGPIRVLYVGSVFSNAQSESLVDIAKAVSHIAGDGDPIRFDIHSPAHLAEPFRARLERSPAVRLHGPIEDDACFFQTMAAADVLVLPINFDPESMRLIRYSMPTKLPAYLASGTPILVYGPPGMAQLEDARRHGWGLVLDRRGTGDVAAALLRLARDAAFGARLSERARALAESRHDVTTVRARFQARLASAAIGRSSTSRTDGAAQTVAGEAAMPRSRR